MSNPRCTALMLWALVAMASPAALTAPSRAQAPAEPAKSTPDSPVVASEETSAPARVIPKRPRTPMDVELFAVLDRQREALAALRTRFREAKDDRTALAVQREIDRVKRDSEISLLRVQADWARRAGRIEAASQIEAAIEQILHPKAPLAVGRVQRDPAGGSR
jgi:hypothetical protein